MSTINVSSGTASTSLSKAASLAADTGKSVKGPAHGLDKSKNGNILTERYTVDVNQGQVVITDRRTGTRTKVGADMKISTGDGDNVRIENGNLTIDLKDGTRITLIPTEDGKAIAKVVITKDREGVTFKNVDTNPKSSGIRKNGDRLDASTEDGTTLIAGNQIDDLYQNGVGQLKGDVTIPGPSTSPEPSPTPSASSPENPAATPGVPPPTSTTPAAGGSGATGSGTSIAEEAQRRQAKFSPDNIDENFDWVYGKLNGKLSEEDRLAVQMFISQLQSFVEMFSNIRKAQSETQRAIVGNLR